MSKAFYAQKDAYGWPIPGTMMSADRIPDSSVEIPNGTPDNLGPGHPSGLRYFVRLDKKGKIIPNSLIVSLKRPSGNVLEFGLNATYPIPF